ncbi:MAG: calcium/sodium antiporter [Clostridia bacterium]|nr:calcium/sodium antiporter [Clostridia bacterium]
MNVFITCLLFAAGIVLVVKGGDVFVDAASYIAKAFHIPPFVIGATIVSIATTLPEMIVSLIAAAAGKTDMAIGNAVGSVTANTALIMAIAMIAMPIVCERKRYLKQILLLIASALVLFLSCRTGELNPIGSLILTVIFILFIVQNLFSAKTDSNKQSGQAMTDKKKLFQNSLLFLLGAAAIVLGSQLMVDNGSKIAVWLGVPERIIAITLIAVGTSLPELVTTISAIVKKEAALSVGNIIGANIIDLSLILPLCAVVSGETLPVAAGSIAVDLPVCLGVTLIATVPLIFRQKASKLQGVLLLAFYALYMIMTVL